jgi:hypothetical protein
MSAAEIIDMKVSKMCLPFAKEKVYSDHAVYFLHNYFGFRNTSSV